MICIFAYICLNTGVAFSRQEPKPGTAHTPLEAEGGSVDRGGPLHRIRHLLSRAEQHLRHPCGLAAPCVEYDMLVSREQLPDRGQAPAVTIINANKWFE